MIKQLAHVCIHSNHLTETERFYCEGLGLDKGFEFVRAGAVFGFYLKVGNDTFIEVFEGEPGEGGIIKHIAIQVDDIEKVIARLREQGYEVGDKKLGADSSWQAWTQDPNGTRIEFHEYTEQSRQLTGGVCEVNW